jgi:hypothetical protein
MSVGVAHRQFTALRRLPKTAERGGSAGNVRVIGTLHRINPNVVPLCKAKKGAATAGFPARSGAIVF